MRRDHHCLLTVLTVLTVVLAGCSGGSDPIPNTGTLTVGLIDMPVRDVDEVWVCITQINIKPQSGPPLEFPFPDADGESGPCDGEQFDLLTLQSVANAELLIAGTEVPAGFYPWMELELDATPPGQGPDADGPYDWQDDFS